MENELIIDGQVVSAPENVAPQEQDVSNQKQGESEKKTTQEQGVDVNNNAEIHSEQEQDYALQIGDEEIALSNDSDEDKAAPQWVRDLRRGFEKIQKENRELKRQLEESTAKQSHQSPVNHDNVIPAKPTLESCDYDEDVYEKALTDWHEKKSHVEQKKQVQQRQQQEVQERFIQRLKSHQQRAAKLPVKDYMEMEEVVRSEIPILQQEILIHAADEGTELIAYALYQYGGLGSLFYLGFTMERKSVFVWSDNEAGFVQAVIVAADFLVFKKMCFVSSIDEVKEPKKAPEKSKEPKKYKSAKDDKTAN